MIKVNNIALLECTTILLANTINQSIKKDQNKSNESNERTQRYKIQKNFKSYLILFWFKKRWSCVIRVSFVSPSFRQTTETM